jgi:hypothetical protein
MRFANIGYISNCMEYSEYKLQTMDESQTGNRYWKKKKTLNHGWILISKQVLLQKFYTGSGYQIIARN